MAMSSGCRKEEPGPESTVTAPNRICLEETPVSVLPPFLPAPQSIVGSVATLPPTAELGPVLPDPLDLVDPALVVPPDRTAPPVAPPPLIVPPAAPVLMASLPPTTPPPPLRLLVRPPEVLRVPPLRRVTERLP